MYQNFYCRCWQEVWDRQRQGSWKHLKAIHGIIVTMSNLLQSNQSHDGHQTPCYWNKQYKSESWCIKILIKISDLFHIIQNVVLKCRPSNVIFVVIRLCNRKQLYVFWHQWKSYSVNVCTSPSLKISSHYSWSKCTLTCLMKCYSFGKTGKMISLASSYSLFPSLKSLFSVSCGFPVVGPCLLFCLLISSGEFVPCTDFVGQ